MWQVYSSSLICCIIFPPSFLDVLRMSISALFFLALPDFRLWNPLPAECFSLTYDLNGFQSGLNRHSLSLVSSWAAFLHPFHPFLLLFLVTSVWSKTQSKYFLKNHSSQFLFLYYLAIFWHIKVYIAQILVYAPLWDFKKRFNHQTYKSSQHTL